MSKSGWTSSAFPSRYSKKHRPISIFAQPAAPISSTNKATRGTWGIQNDIKFAPKWRHRVYGLGELRTRSVRRPAPCTKISRSDRLRGVMKGEGGGIANNLDIKYD
jgi:hypothetical protein